MYEKQIQRFLQLRARKLEAGQGSGDNGEDTPPFEARTMLYIRAFDGDTGSRPVPAGTVFWLSPDIEVFDLAAGRYVLESTLVPGQAYRIDVTVNNAGDLPATACNVDLFITDFTVGFSNPPRVGPPQLLAVPPRGKAVASFAYTPTSAGHRCLFARAWSLASMDYPGCENTDRKMVTQVVDMTTTMRQVGQQNLDVIQQGQTLDFALATTTLPEGRGHFVVQAAATLPAKLKRQLGRPRFLALTAQRAQALDGLKLARVDASPVIRPPLIPARLNLQPAKDLAVLGRLTPAARAKLKGWQLESAGGAVEKLRLALPHLGLIEGEVTALHLWLLGPDGRRHGGATVIVRG